MYSGIGRVGRWLQHNLHRAALAAEGGRLRLPGLWIERPPAELRGGIAGTLTGGLEQVYELGRILALGP